MGRTATRLALTLLVVAPGLGLVTTPLQAQTAEDLLSAHAEEIDRLMSESCPTGPEGEIVVCGRRRDDREQRLPLPVEREPGARIPGEPPPMVECLRLCHKPLRVDLIGGDRTIMRTIARGIDRLLHPD